MTKQEVARLIALVTTVYPNIRLVDGEVTTVDAWHFLLDDQPYDLAKQALKAVLQRQLYPTLPTIGAIRQEIVYLKNGRPLAPAVAFQQAQTWAHSDIELDEATLEAAKVITSWELKTSENPSATRSQFIKVYEAIVARRNDENIVSIGKSPELTAIEGGKNEQESV